jgi:transcriptional regulator with XRE-family HTH domain
MRTSLAPHPDDVDARRRIAWQLRYIRQAAGLNQADLADHLGIDRSRISEREINHAWTVPHVQAWARGLARRIDMQVTGLAVPDDGDLLAAVYVGQQPRTAEEEDRLDLRILVNNLARIRRHQGLTLREFGARIGCSHTAMWHREMEPDGAQVDSVQRHVRALGGVLQMDVVPEMSPVGAR